MDDPVNAFVDTFTLPGNPTGPLAGLTFGAKDIFDIAGRVAGCGSPDWKQSHPVATTHAPAIATLLDAGANLEGMTHTDELVYSLMGVNAHYGTPMNSADPRRVPGGSSSGSAAAVAAGLVDIGLGSDTGGSVRLPASFCGVWGIRTTFGQISLDGVMPFTRSFDTVGWFARSPVVMAGVARAFGCPDGVPPARLLLPVDIWARASADTVAALGPALAKLEADLGPAVPVLLCPEGIERWRETFRICQAFEVWRTHGDWVRAHSPDFGPGIRERFEIASRIDRASFDVASAQAADIAARIAGILGEDAVLVLPTGPGPAPLLTTSDGGLDAFRMRAFDMLCIAGLAGLPQLSAPGGVVDGGPVGLSVVGGRGQDRQLIACAAALFDAARAT